LRLLQTRPRADVISMRLPDNVATRILGDRILIFAVANRPSLD
jgi:hypothetical protein